MWNRTTKQRKAAVKRRAHQKYVEATQRVLAMAGKSKDTRKRLAPLPVRWG